MKYVVALATLVVAFSGCGGSVNSSCNLVTCSSDAPKKHVVCTLGNYRGDGDNECQVKNSLRKLILGKGDTKANCEYIECKAAPQR